MYLHVLHIRMYFVGMYLCKYQYNAVSNININANMYFEIHKMNTHMNTHTSKSINTEV